MADALKLVIEAGVARVTLDNPAKHNAFDEALIATLARAWSYLAARTDVRAVVLQGAGLSFSAGADLDWMKRAAGQGRDANRADAEALARMLEALATLPKPTVARVHGAVFGGGVGLVAACDIAVAAEDAVFSLSEVRLGLVPAVISPYVLAAVGARAARKLMLTAERFGAAEAHRLGLVHQVVPAEGLDAAVAKVLADLAQGGPRAQAEVKRLTRAIAGRPVDASVIAATSVSIAEARASSEGKEGVAAFLEKRKPGWRA